MFRIFMPSKFVALMTTKSILIEFALALQPEINEHRTKTEKQNTPHKEGTTNTQYEDGKLKQTNM
jgi:hypothetical protein